MNKDQYMIDILDIMATQKRGFSIADLMFQLSTLYATRGEKPDQVVIQKVLDELTEQGYLKTFQVGALPQWKITEEGEDYFYSL
ncbi:MAG: hypothetical protein ACTSQE_09435 [Candidatus Heimdallarchaeaceae archaeon]